jgi:hypothetical protein
VLTGTGRCEIVVARGAVTGVRTAAGELLDIDAAVLATGSDVPRTVAQLGVGIPDATPIGLLVRTLPIGTRLRAVLNAPRVYVRPTPSGARVLEGLVRAGGRPPGGRDLRGREVHGRRLLHEASAVLEGNPALTLESYGAGPKPVPGDGEPMLGALAEVPGYHVAFTHSGATLALIVGSCLPKRSSPASPAPCRRLLPQPLPRRRSHRLRQLPGSGPEGPTPRGCGSWRNDVHESIDHQTRGRGAVGDVGVRKGRGHREVRAVPPAAPHSEGRRGARGSVDMVGRRASVGDAGDQVHPTAWGAAGCPEVRT